jgi:hypothetical protein
VELDHWATPVLSLEIRHNIYHYCSTSMALPGPWPYASKCLIEKILPPNAILTLGPTGLST